MKVADEEVTRIKTAELSMTLGRHTPTKPLGLSIEGGDGRFVLPDGTLDSSASNTTFVDSQVSFHKFSSFSKNPRLAFLLSNEDRNQISYVTCAAREIISTCIEVEELQSRAENREERLWCVALIWNDCPSWSLIHLLFKKDYPWAPVWWRVMGPGHFCLWRFGQFI